jgi:MFS family permease
MARVFSGVIFSVLDYRKVNYVVVAVLGLSVMVIPSQGTVAAFGVSYSFYAVSRGLLRVSSGAMVLSEFEGGRQGKGVASGLYHAGLDLGVLLGPALAGFSAQLFGIPATLRLLPLFFLGLIYALLLVARYREKALHRVKSISFHGSEPQ